jgi:hypothetical protein
MDMSTAYQLAESVSVLPLHSRNNCSGSGRLRASDAPRQANLGKKSLDRPFSFRYPT